VLSIGPSIQRGGCWPLCGFMQSTAPPLAAVETQLTNVSTVGKAKRQLLYRVGTPQIVRIAARTWGSLLKRVCRSCALRY